MGLHNFGLSVIIWFRAAHLHKGIRVSKAPLVLRSYHILLLQINLHINIWYRAGASHPFDTLIILGRKGKEKR